MPEFLTRPANAVEKANQIQAVCGEFREQLRAGHSARIEDVVARHGEIDRPNLLTALITAEVSHRRDCGESVTADEYVQRFPADAGIVEDSFSRIVDSSKDLLCSTVAIYMERPPVSQTHPHSWRPRLGRYELIKLIGRGSFGEVWRAFDPQLERHVALKIVRRDRNLPDSVFASFQCEGRRLAKLQHPGIVAVFDFGCDQGVSYIVSELVEGGTLAGMIRKGPLAPETAATLVVDVAEALHHAHLKGIIHRDVKPSNILISANAKPRIADFGLAISEEEQLAESGTRRGTLAYMSPEQVCGESHRLDARSDVYSLGVVLYQLLTGRLPFVSESAEQYADQILNRQPRPPRTIRESIPPELERICLKCLAKPVGDRYSTAGDVARDLRRALGRREHSRSWRLAAVVVLFVGALMVASLGSSERGGSAPWVRDPIGTGRPIAGAASESTGVELHRPDSAQLMPGFPHEVVVDELNWAERDLTTWEILPGQRTMRIIADDLALMKLGELDDDSLELEIAVSQEGWDGRVGFFFGHTFLGDDPTEVVFYSVELRSAVIGHTGHRLVITRRELSRSGPVSKAERILAAAPVALLGSPQPRVFAIQIERGRLVNVRFDDVEFPHLVAEATVMTNSPLLGRGRYGIFCASTSTTVSEPQINGIPARFATSRELP